ncbi:DUF937 domain-containing protein [Nostoc spongiaeforme FACHB-130]|uniref:DUF937 domain-containing protein n=1 Tax=Nostoc spongiaeforme FACHB-130 TaxID=1357510 RepID=A0ABR8G3U8_9NOSO|nr:DUF937 domain-containing protein [Nostoc spongiaeforme]MBD2597839.1 DUF937 domain-containing protein [Nostoc spongiaeforme FACHB-130]
MGLFDQILSAVGNTNQLGGIINTVQQLSDRTGADASTIQSVLGIVGNYVRSSLQEKQATNGEGEVQALVNQYAGTSPNPQAVDSLFSGVMQQQVAEAVAQRTGLDAGTIQQLLPSIVPVVLNFLQSSGSGSNSVLNAFLDADKDGDVDIADAIRLASQYLGR